MHVYGSESGAPSPIRVPNARCRVLVIDDEPFVGRAMARVLEREHVVEVVNSAEEVTHRIAGGERWDAIFCDLLMPGMTGMDFARAVETSAPEVARRVVFMTGGACTERSRAFLDGGGYAYLEKPIEPSLLREAVAKVIAAG